MMLATAEALPDGVGVRDAHAEQMGDVRVRAEAAVANPDCILRAEDRRHEGVMHAVDGERAHAEPVDVESIPEAEPVQLREIVDLTVEVREQSLLVRSDVRHASALEDRARSAKGDRAHDVRAARLMAIRERRPLDVVGGHVADGAAAGKHRLGVGEHRRRPDQNAAAERRVHLVPREREEVDAHRHHVDGSVRRQLGGVDREQRSVLMREQSDLGDGKDLPGDVARARDRDDPDGAVAILEGAAKIGEQLLRRLRRVEQVDPGQAPPRQHVRVVLDDRAQHRVPGSQHQAVGQQVDGLGGVSDKDDSVCRAGARERRHRRSRCLVGAGRHLGGESRPAMHARVPGEELDHGVRDRLHRRCARRHVEVHVAARLAAGQLYLQVLADEAGEDDTRRAAPGPAPTAGFGEHQAFEGTATRPSSTTLATTSPPR